MICKGAALSIVFLAGNSEGLEAWRRLTEMNEPKMRTRFVLVDEIKFQNVSAQITPIEAEDPLADAC